MTIVSETIIAAAILIGAFFLFVGSFAMVKLPDLMRRLHGPTKATTLGIGSLLIASVLFFFLSENRPTLHEVLISLFLFMTAPVSALMIAKAYILLDHSPASLPDAPDRAGWATLTPPREPRPRA